MGWTRASEIAQDLANALVWRHGQLTDAALAPHIAELRRLVPAFDAFWKTRLALGSDAYGPHARLVEALQYTDDKAAAAATPTACAVRALGACPPAHREDHGPVLDAEERVGRRRVEDREALGGAAALYVPEEVEAELLLVALRPEGLLQRLTAQTLLLLMARRSALCPTESDGHG